MIIGIVSQQAQLGERGGKKFGQVSGNRVCMMLLIPLTETVLFASRFIGSRKTILDLLKDGLDQAAALMRPMLGI